MTVYDAIKARLDSEVQALESLAQAAEEGLGKLFHEDDWDESVISVVRNYPNGLREWRNRLSLVRNQVKEPEPAPPSPLESLADAVRRMAANQEEVAKRLAVNQEEVATRMAAAHEEISKRMAAAHEEIAAHLAIVHEQTAHYMSASGSAMEETTQNFHELSEHVQSVVSSARPEEYPGAAPGQPPIQPDAPPPDDPPEDSGFWKS